MALFPTLPLRRAGASPRPSRRERGAVLIVALLFAALIAIVLGSYLSLNLSSARLAKRNFNRYAALNLAESGAEEALWSFNRKAGGDGAAWGDWNTSGSSAWRKFPATDFGGNASGWMKVYVDTYQPSAQSKPKIITQASVTTSGDTTVTKMIEVSLRRRSHFASALVAKDKIAFTGPNTSVDSWNSNPDGNAATPPVPYDPSIKTANGAIASASVLNTAVFANKADVWGFVSTGGAPPNLGKEGTVKGPDTPTGVAIDPKRVATDFNADFPLVPMPLDGVPLAALGPTLGTTGMATKWRIPTLELKGAETLTILGDVTLILTGGGAGGDALTVSGFASIIIPNGSSLTIYVEGNVTIGGKGGLVNYNVNPSSCRIWGTNQSAAGQTIDITGNGSLVGVIYAPQADVTIGGNGNVMGSIVSDTITVSGNAAFHYDEALAESDGNEPFQIAKWRELNTAAEREPYEALFQGW